ncbi:MAG: Mur ligase family protein [Rubricoccaceae bacterium]|nr:Mur ligase family protein [Rubricoccaceae bacterium]
MCTGRVRSPDPDAIETISQMIVEDSRRLTGPNLYLDGAGAIMDVHGEGIVFDSALEFWAQHILVLLKAVGWTGSVTSVRRFSYGASLAFSGPIDALYAGTEINEAAWEAAVGTATAGIPPDPLTKLSELKKLIAEERNPALLALERATMEHDLTFLWDDDYASIGLGNGSKTWAVDKLPAPDGVDWALHHDIPVALITGTNGKSTTARLLGSILRAAGKTPGLTSTDYIAVGDEILDRGDYSGPGGARTAMRDQRVDAGVLEVARGGILRRGLGVPTASAAAVTNVAADHLGDYGIESVADLAQAKFVVAKALREGGVLVTNADNTFCRKEVNRLAESLKKRGATVCWTSPNPENPLIAEAGQTDGRACSVIDGELAYSENDSWKPVVSAAELPVTFGGRATYNIRNCLTALGLAKALGIEDEAIEKGLRSFESDPETNPGRGNLFDVQGAQILIDFAHNEHALSAIAESITRIPAKRRLVLMGQAGDRTDDEVRGLTRAAAMLNADRYVLVDMPNYLRGKETGEVPAFINSVLLNEGIPDSSIVFEADPINGTRHALDWAQPGDFLLLLSLTQREECIALIRERIASETDG